jgi:hypothetical protein
LLLATHESSPRKRAAVGRSTFQAAYSVSPDGRRCLVHLLDSKAIPTQIDVVMNWFEELRAKVPRANNNDERPKLIRDTVSSTLAVITQAFAVSVTA